MADPEAINVTEANKLRNSDNPWAGYFGILAVAFSSDGDKMVVLDYILDAQGQIIGRLEQPKGWGYFPWYSSPQFSPDSRKLIAPNPWAASGYVWNSHGQLLLNPFFAREHGYSGAGTFSPDSSRLVTNATLQEDDPLKLWDSQGEQLVLVANLEGHHDSVSAMAFSQNSRLLATSDDHAIRLWSRQGQLLKMFPGQHVKPILSLRFNLQFGLRCYPGLQFSPDGRRLISHGEDYTLRVWDVSGLQYDRPSP